MDEDDLNI